MDHPRVLRIAAAVLVASAAACDARPSTPPATVAPTTPPATVAPTTAGPSSGPSTAPGSGAPAPAVYAEIRAAVGAIRGLQASADVEPVTIDETQLRTNLAAEFDKEYPAAKLKASEDLLIRLGLLPVGASLRAIMLDFQAGQVAGYYSPDRDELYVVSRSGNLGAAELVTYAHEYTHQLQDQAIGLDDLGLAVTDQTDRSLARLALVEGDATSVQTQWMLANLDAQQLGELLGSALDPNALEALLRAPAFVRETALFPYEEGALFASQILGSGGYEALDAAYETPPDSTEQVLHPELYTQRHPPIAVSLPQTLAAAAGAGWTETGRDTLGELVLRIWLEQGGVLPADAAAAAAGWGGDRLALLRGPGGEVTVALLTAWDTPADAAEFATAAATALTLMARGADSAMEAPDDGSAVALAIGPGAAALVQALQP